MHRLQEIVRLHRLGRGSRSIARELKISPNTERRYRTIFAEAGLLEGDPDMLPELAELRAAVDADAAANAKPNTKSVSSIASWRPEIERLYPLTHHEPIDLFAIVRQRYEKRATVYTSNRSIEEWAAIFRDELLASAAVDRILHNAHVIVMEGDTYRNPPPGRRRVKAASVVA